MSPVSAPADKRFRRAHVKPARRRRWRTLAVPVAKYVVLAALALFVIYRGGLVVAHAKTLQIRTITVKGNVQVARSDVAAALSGMAGENILWSDLAMWRERLLSSPWIKDAALRRILPSTIEVVVRERAPVGLGRINGALFLVDEMGVIDEFDPAREGVDLPIIDGLADFRGKEGPVEYERAELAARLIAAVAADPDMQDRVSEIDVSDPRNAAVLLSGDPTLLYVGTERFLPRLQAYLQLADAMRNTVKSIDYVDLRFDDRIYVGPSGGTSKRDASAVSLGPAPQPSTAPSRAKSAVTTKRRR